MTKTIIPTPDAGGTLAPVGQAGMTDLLRFAVDKGAPIESLERLVALQERIMDRNAASEFFEAMAQFRGACPPIKKSSRAEFATRGGSKASYTYAELDEIARTVDPILSRFGLSYSWDSEVSAEGMMVCTCTLRHRAGHAVTAKFGSKVEGSALMSGHQATAATLTYARRQSLVQVLGLTTTDGDVDGHEPRVEVLETPESDRITEHEAANLRALAEEVGADRAGFLAYFRIANLEELPKAALPKAIKMLEGKRRK